MELGVAELVQAREYFLQDSNCSNLVLGVDSQHLLCIHKEHLRPMIHPDGIENQRMKVLTTDFAEPSIILG